jgi:hypothetical chaperone protein
LIRLSPERAKSSDRKSDILSNGGVHIGGTDFDRALSLACVMPSLGLGGLLKTGLQVPSAQYFNLATWHTINMAYTRKASAQIDDLYREASDKSALERLRRLVSQREGHWLALQVEEAKIELSDAPSSQINMGRIESGQIVALEREQLDRAISPLVLMVEQTVSRLLLEAGVNAQAIDTVFFTGGSSGVPLLRQKILALTPGSRSVEGDLFGSIGTGLALDAVRKFGHA